jgi:putative Holliday junction resolvase
MKILGIDYGSKRVGLATCDTESGMAFPKSVVNNDKNLLNVILELCKKEGMGEIVMGESKNLNGEDNSITEDSRVFKTKLSVAFGKEVIFVPEFYSTYQASRIQGDSNMIDASAAAIILQSYVDKLKITNNK